MTPPQQTDLPEAEVRAFLGGHETGVLSLARGDAPYAVPISFGFDGEQFFLRLVSTPDSEKHRFVRESQRARLVVYEANGTRFRSAVAEGRLEVVPRSALTADHVEQYGDAKRPLFEMWQESTADLDVDLYRLDPETLSGREVDVPAEATDGPAAGEARDS